MFRWAIWNTQGLFLDLYNAIGQSSSTLSGNIGAIVLAMDPPSEGTSPWEYVFDALTFGLSLYSEGSILIKALLRSAPQSSTLFDKLLFPPGDINGDIEAWADVAKQVSDFSVVWQKFIGSGLPDVVNDLATFTGFCEKGPITGERPPLDGLTTSVAQSVGAYVHEILCQLREHTELTNPADHLSDHYPAQLRRHPRRQSRCFKSTKHRDTLVGHRMRGRLRQQRHL